MKHNSHFLIFTWGGGKKTTKLQPCDFNYAIIIIIFASLYPLRK